MNVITKAVILCFAIFGIAVAGILVADQFIDEENPDTVNHSASAYAVAVEVPGCKNLDLIMTSECLHKEISKIFSYSLRDDVERTIEDLKEFGGDCYDWNLLYKKWLEQLGFRAEMVWFELNEETSHVVTIGYTHNAYCILDQTVAPSCVILGGESNGN